MTYSMISVASGFQYSVNIGYDLNHDDKLRNFIPTKSALQLLEDILASTAPTSTDRARVLIGAYGKGKSHIVLTILSMLLKKDLRLFEKLMPKVEANPRLLQLVQNYYESNNKILPVVITGSSTSLTQAFMLSLQHTLSEFDLLDAMPETNYKAATAVISRWEKEFPETFEKFVAQIDDPIEVFLYKLSGFDVSAYETFERIVSMLGHPASLSLMTSWSRSLTEDQKRILLDFSQNEFIYQEHCPHSIEMINELGDIAGLGLLVHNSDEKGRYWKLNTELYKQFIVTKNKEFLAADIVQPEKNDDTLQHGPTYVQNNFYINNFFNPTDAVKSLLALKEITTRTKIQQPEPIYIANAMKCLPYQQSGWEDLKDEQKDEQMNEYADRIFDSGEFRADALSENQMQRFSLTQSLLDRLSDNSRDNLISAIQVYDLLQFCIDRFKLNMINSESARGILFAKLYESIFIIPGILRENRHDRLAAIPGRSAFRGNAAAALHGQISVFAHFLPSLIRKYFT